MMNNSKWTYIFAVILGTTALLRAGVEKNVEPKRTGTLSSLERRALTAQALFQQIETLEKKVDEVQEKVESQKEKIEELSEELKLSQEKVASLEKSLEERDEEIAKQKKMLSVFRSGSFEYYEVSDGDTVESIAAKPMIYGDASRSTLIEQANNISKTEKLLPGTILIVPRYPEGVIHEL